MHVGVAFLLCADAGHESFLVGMSWRRTDMLGCGEVGAGGSRAGGGEDGLLCAGSGPRVVFCMGRVG